LTDEQLSLVFFSLASDGYRINLRQVSRHGDKIQVQYQLEPYAERVVSVSFALIPIGELPVGIYQVEMKQIPTKQEFVALGYKPLDNDWTRRFVCKPFSINVVEGFTE
jgi:hypothetical protein